MDGGPVKLQQPQPLQTPGTPLPAPSAEVIEDDVRLVVGVLRVLENEFDVFTQLLAVLVELGLRAIK